MALKIGVVVTAGNHDFGGFIAEKLHRVLPQYQRARAQVERAFEPALQQPSVVAHTRLDSISRFGDHVFVALCSEHRGTPRIKRIQIDWATAALSAFLLAHKPQNGPRFFFHFVTHHSLWSDATDKHRAMSAVERLEKRLLRHFQFFSFIHGHNHRFSFQNTNCPHTNYRILRLSMPTLSTRNMQFERGFVRWNLKTIEHEQPVLVHFREDLHLESAQVANSNNNNDGDGDDVDLAMEDEKELKESKEVASSAAAASSSAVITVSNHDHHLIDHNNNDEPEPLTPPAVLSPNGPSDSASGGALGSDELKLAESNLEYDPNGWPKFDPSGALICSRFCTMCAHI